MSAKRFDDIILRMENYLECWKQFNHYLSLARFKKFTLDDENQFMEIKSVITQELELILTVTEGAQVSHPADVRAVHALSERKQ
jgi:hypothetical protein